MRWSLGLMVASALWGLGCQPVRPLDSASTSAEGAEGSASGTSAEGGEAGGSGDEGDAGQDDQGGEAGSLSGSADTSAEDGEEGGVTEGGDGDGDEDACPFVCLPYDIPPHCDPGQQDCPEGSKCTAYISEPGYCCFDANKCVPVIGEVQEGEPCTREGDNDDCDVGLFCWGQTPGAEGPGVCVAFCDVNSDEACPDQGMGPGQCTVSGRGAMPFCQYFCDPLAQNCEMGQGCYGTGQEFVCAAAEANPNAGQDGDECFTLSSCDPGLQCISGVALGECGSDSCCSPFCDLSLPGSCTDPDESCLPWFEAGTAPEGYENVGICALP